MSQHVKAWNRSDTMSFVDAEKYRETLLDMWYKSRWSTTFCGRTIIGELKAVNEYGANGDPTFTIEFSDPDYPSNTLTLTGQFSRFSPTK